MTSTASSTRERLDALLGELSEYRKQIGTPATSAGDRGELRAHVDALADAAHQLWPADDTEHRSPEFEEILRIKGDIANLVIECRRLLPH
ncbi:TPA: hypothetical protein ACK3Q6_007659 [Burkholderia cepacia]